MTKALAKDRAAQLRALPPWRRTLDVKPKAADGKGQPAVADGAAGAAAQPAPADASPPGETPTLAWVHGYRGHDCRGNVFFSSQGEAVCPATSSHAIASHLLSSPLIPSHLLSYRLISSPLIASPRIASPLIASPRIASHLISGEAVYPAASVIVLSGVAAEGGRRKQRFFDQHTDDVLCLASHPSRTLFASGQKAFAHRANARSAPILVWEAESLTVKARLSGVHEIAVTCVAFSPTDGT
jgi:WD40 repeat protein